ncbi:MAG TPA: HAD-IIA family hydrolase [Mycobacteriales bacterium]|nr:HAD-IIA family hydrolase [Mycobacteriales bacterium]
MKGSDQPPAQQYDVALLDLDGVVYLGSTPIDGIPEALAEVRGTGMRLAFVTNNASRTPAAAAAMLSGMGVQAAADEVTNSAQAACHVMAEKLPPGAKVLVVGTTGLIEAARERGFTLVTSADDEPAAVVQGYGANVGWRDLAEATVAIRRGAWFVATNLDSTVPSERGPLPGNGSLVGVVRETTGVTPTSTGKPDPAMHRESVQRSGARRPIVVGDRLDTDIEGASRVGCDSMLVLTGVTTPADLLRAVPEQRPTYVGASVRALLEPQPGPTRDGDAWTCGGWTVRGGLTLAGSGADLDALRALCAAAWAGGGTEVHTDGSAAAETAQRLGVQGRLGR